MTTKKTLQIRARALRHQQTDVEKLLWHHLRNRQLGGYKFRRQVIIESYIVDFVCIEQSLIVEADGSQHMEQKVYDDARSFTLSRAGFKLIRFWNHDILNQTESVLEQIYNALQDGF